MPIITKELQSELPNVQAAPVNSFRTPSATPPSQLGSLLEGLGKLSPGVTKFMTAVDDNQGDTAEQEARMQALTADPKVLRDEVAGGNYFGMAHTRAKTALSIMDAQNRAFDVSRELDAAKARGDFATSDPQTIFKTAMGDHGDAITDPLAKKAFVNTLAPVMQQFKNTAQHAAIAQAEGDKEAQLFKYATGIHDQIDREVAAGHMKPEEAEAAHKKAMFGAADFAKGNLLMSPGQVSTVMGRVMQHYAAAGNVPVLGVLGGFDRGGGTTLRDQFGPQYDSWVEQAKAKTLSDKTKAVNKNVDTLEADALQGQGKPEEFYQRVETARAADPENFPAAKVERLKMLYNNTVATNQKHALAQQSAIQAEQNERGYIETGAAELANGRRAFMPDKTYFKTADGTEYTYQSKDYETRMYQRAEALIEQQAKDGKWSDEALMDAKVHLYGQNGGVHPAMQGSFNDIFQSSKAGIPANPQKLPQQLANLEYLRTKDPTQYLNLAGASGAEGKKQETWLAAYRAGRDYGMDPERAYGVANQRVFNPAAQERWKPGELASKTDDVMQQFGKVGVLMGPIARSKAREAVDLQVAAGTADKDIIPRAVESLKNSHLIVNGVPVHNSIPGVADSSVATEYLQDGAAFFKKENAGLRDAKFPVAFADDPARSGYYIAIRTDTGERISRTGVSGEQLKDYVLQWRERNKQQQSSDAAARVRDLPAATRAEASRRGVDLPTPRKRLSDALPPLNPQGQ